MTWPGYRAGQKPPNYGRKFPAEILTPEEIARLLAACSPRGKAGMRDRAMIVVLWRGGLRVAEALALRPSDVDVDRGTVTIRHGKGNKRRTVGLDRQALAVVELWLEKRRTLGVSPRGPLFCTITAGNVGGVVRAAAFREKLHVLARRAQIDKRVHPHGFRHTHAVELMFEGVPVPLIQQQLGHNSLATTERYLRHIAPADLVDAIQAREWPAQVAHLAPPGREKRSIAA